MPQVQEHAEAVQGHLRAQVASLVSLAAITVAAALVAAALAAIAVAAALVAATLAVIAVAADLAAATGLQCPVKDVFGGLQLACVPV